MGRSRSADGQVGKLASQYVGRKFWLTRGLPSKTEVFSAHWRARLLPSRNFGRSANQQVGKSGSRQISRSVNRQMGKSAWEGEAPVEHYYGLNSVGLVTNDH